MLFRFNSYQGSVAFSSANSVAGVIYQGKANITSFLSLRDVNKELTIANVNLQQQVLQLKKQLKKYGASSHHIEQALRERNYTLIGAQVIQNSVNKRDNLITIDRGSADGVKEDMGVVSGNGVVGVVYMVGTHYSVVMPIISVHSGISCEVDGTGYFGYLRWVGNDCHYAYMEDVPLYADIKKNQWVVTSGYSAIFPCRIANRKNTCFRENS